MSELKRTPLFEFYQDNKVKLVDFGGWAMPIQFTSIMKEHESVRERVGLFDCSHMGEILVTGKRAEDYLNHLLTNNVRKMSNSSVQYNLFCQEDGGVIDDVMVYRFHSEAFVVVPNASNTDKVWSWMNKHMQENVKIENKSQEIGLIAVQGPLAEELLQTLTDTDLSEIGRHQFAENIVLAEEEILFMSRTGYTGEDGFEIYLSAPKTRKLWEKLFETAKESDGLLCGLGARDTLRLEAGLPLYGQELSETISPIMAGVGFAVKTKKADVFIGQDVLRNQREQGTDKKVVGFETVERGIPRHGYKIFSKEGIEIGEVTSGTQSPTLKKGIGMALVDTSFATKNTEIVIEIRNKLIPAKITNKTFLK